MATRDKDEHAFTPMLAHGKSVQDQNMVALDDDNEAEDEDVATAMTRGDSFDSMIATNTTPTTDYGGNGLVSMPATISASSPTYLPREQEVAQLLTGLRDGLIVPPASSSVVASRETGTTPRATFISRVSNLPMVNATMQTITNVYESGKNTSTVLKVFFCGIEDYSFPLFSDSRYSSTLRRRWSTRSSLLSTIPNQCCLRRLDGWTSLHSASWISSRASTLPSIISRCPPRPKRHCP